MTAPHITTYRKKATALFQRRKQKNPVREAHFPHLRINSRDSLLYVTLPGVFATKKNRPAVRTSTLKTRTDTTTRFLFYPEQVVARSYEDVTLALQRYEITSSFEGTVTKAVDTRRTLSHTFHFVSKDDPRVLLKDQSYDVLQIEKFFSEYKQAFPHLATKRTIHYRLYLIQLHTNIDLLNKESIEILPDSDVIEASVRLGVVDAKAKAQHVHQARSEILKETPLSAIDMHPVLKSRKNNGYTPV